jgi:iduronate 2-sulfatase
MEHSRLGTVVSEKVPLLGIHRSSVPRIALPKLRLHPARMAHPKYTLLQFFTFAVIAVVSLVSPSRAVAATGQSKTNVLFIMADDFRAELSSYGSRAITPSLERLAKKSLQFNRMYAQQAVCNPSRSSLLTGMRPDTLRVWNNSTHFRTPNPDITTLPLWFKEHGYTSRCVGKIFHNWHTVEKGDARSWSAPEFLHYANHGADSPQGKDLPESSPMQTTLRYGAGPLCEMRNVPDEAYYDGRVANEAVRVLGEVREQPFFLAVGFWKPHAPFNAPRKYWDLYQRRDFEKFNAARPEGAPALAFHKSTEILGKNGDAESLPTAQAAEMRHGYFANISFLDAQIGKLLDALETSGLAERTAVVFLSDHGYHVGEHGLWGKTSNFEFDARVPVFVSAPGMRSAGATTDALGELIDLFPTLTQLCGLPAAPRLEGRSLVPVLENPVAPGKKGAFSQHPRPAYFDREPSKMPEAMGVSVRTPSVRYTEWRDWKTGGVLARELYDSIADPAETRNRADEPEFADRQKEASSLLVAQFPPTRHP